METYRGQHLSGYWHITYKLDGVQVVVKDGEKPVSRAGKCLYNVPLLRRGVYEYFHNDWNTSVSDMRTRDGRSLRPSNFYRIGPTGLDVDERLYRGMVLSGAGRHSQILYEYKKALAEGYEGLVLWGPNNQQLKMKPVETYDLKVTGVREGKGRLIGVMGALRTEIGNVGTGFTRAERAEKWRIGEIIEVSCQGLTKMGLLRHPRFIRRRPDKVRPAGYGDDAAF